MAFNSFLYHIVIIIIVSLVNNTIIVLNRSKEVCLYKELFSDDSVKISYSITGSSENAVTCTFYGPNGDILFEKSNHNSGDFQHKTVVPEGSLGTYNLCFKQNYGKNFISFEFSSTQEGGDIIKIAKEQTITGLSNNLTTISNYLEEIENKIKKYIFRKRAHNSKSIKQYTYLKFSLIIFLSIIQIYIIRRFFDNRKPKINFTNPFIDSTL